MDNRKSKISSKTSDENNILSLSEYRKKSWKKQEEEIVSGGVFTKEREHTGAFVLDEPEISVYKDPKILSLPEYLKKNSKRDKTKLSATKAKKSRKRGNLIIFDKYKQKKYWKKNLSFYGQEAGQVVAMAFMFVFMFVFALEFRGSLQEESNRSVAFIENPKTEKDYIKAIKSRERTKSAGKAHSLDGSGY